MSKPFDAATKFLLERHPADWLAFAGLPVEEVEIIDADLSSITAAADKILRVKGPPPWLGHVELQSSYEDDMDERFHFYSVVQRWRHRLPVVTIVVLLRPEADGPTMTGELRYYRPDGECYEWFRYHVVRVWERPVEEILQGGLGTLPLAPLTDVKPDALPEVIRRMDARISAEAAAGEAEDLWAATFLLMGLRYPAALTKQLLQGVRNMRESVTYQEILKEGEAKGRAEGERDVILLQGRKRFGAPDAKTVAALEAIAERETLERLAERLLEVESWNELLAEE